MRMWDLLAAVDGRIVALVWLAFAVLLICWVVRAPSHCDVDEIGFSEFRAWFEHQDGQR